jgi:YD repeat-containing protein
MQIKQHGNGRAVVTVNGKEIIDQYGNGDRYLSYYDSNNRLIRSGDSAYAYDEEGNHIRTVSDSGIVSHYAYDPYGNRIGSCDPSSWSRTRSVTTYTYSRRKDGSVESKYKDEETFSSYEAWRDALPTDFEPAPYKEPEKKEKAKKMFPSYDGWAAVDYESPLDSRYLSEVYERLQREQAEGRAAAFRTRTPHYTAVSDPAYAGQIRFVQRDSNPYDML